MMMTIRKSKVLLLLVPLLLGLTLLLPISPLAQGAPGEAWIYGTISTARNSPSLRLRSPSCPRWKMMKKIPFPKP